MLNNIRIFPNEGFPKGKFRVVVLDAYGAENINGDVTIYLVLLLFDPKTKNIYEFCDTVVNDTRNPRSKSFFDFLENSGVAMEQYDDLAGMVFEAEVATEQHQKLEVPILCNLKLLTLPLEVQE